MKTNSTLIIVILFLIATIFIQKCNNGKYIPQKNDTLFVHDTINIHIKGDISYVPKPYKVEVKGKDSILILKDTPQTLLEYRDAYFKLMIQYVNTSYYSDTLPINDSGLIGYMYTNDTLQKNKIQGKSMGYKLTYPKIKETITITKYPPKKTMWFVGGAVLVNYPLQNIGMEINGGFLNKKNQFYEIGAQSFNNQLIYKLGTKIKL